MKMSTELAVSMRESFDVIEEAYEFMLAYAAQGRRSELFEGAGKSQIRNYLQRFRDAASDLCETLDSMTESRASNAFRVQWIADLNAVMSVIDMLLNQPSITSEMIDNANGMIVLRSAFTNMFFADHVMLPRR